VPINDQDKLMIPKDLCERAVSPQIPQNIPEKSLAGPASPC
jgi:hypothetical protein